MTDLSIAKRLVFHLGGYDAMPPEATHRRFARELRRFEGTWSVTASISEAEITADEAAWRITSSGPNWQVATDFRLVRWDDLVDAADRQSLWRHMLPGLLAFLDFVAAGAFWGYVRANWRYAAFFLYPFLVLAVLALLAAFVGRLVAKAIPSDLAGAAAGMLVFTAFVRWPAGPLHISRLFGDWIFSRVYIRRGDPVLNARLDRFAREIAAAARTNEWDEILVVGHSLGAVLAVDLLDRALRLDQALGQAGPRVAFVSVGSSILKIGLHRGAKRFHAAVERVASAPGIFWAEYQALTDVMNFYKTEPVAAMGLSAPRHPTVRIVRISRMLDAAAYRRIRRNFFRVHCQFVSANDRRAAYDYFMLLCGPLSIERQVRSQDGAASAIGPDGACVALAEKLPAQGYLAKVSMQ